MQRLFVAFGRRSALDARRSTLNAPRALGRVIDVDVASLPGSALCVIDADADADVDVDVVVNVAPGRIAKFFFYIFNAHSVFILIVHEGAHWLSLCSLLTSLLLRDLSIRSFFPA